MKLAKIAMAVATIITSAVSFAGTLTSSSNVEFLAFDGQKVRKKATLQINDTNKHQAVVEVSGIYRSGSEDSYFSSEPIILTFDGSAENIHIVAPELRSEVDVNKFKKSPTFEIKTASGSTVAYQTDYLKGEGFMPNARIEENLSAYNASGAKAAVSSFAEPKMAVAIPVNAGKANKGQVMVQGENIAEQQLQYWFQQADKETQKRFLDWAKKQ